MLLETKTVIRLSEIYTVSDVSALLRCTDRLTMKFIHSGILRYRILGKRTYVVTGASIKHMLETGLHDLSEYTNLLFTFEEQRHECGIKMNKEQISVKRGIRNFVLEELKVPLDVVFLPPSDYSIIYLFNGKLTEKYAWDSEMRKWNYEKSF